ncbi:MAG TPA: ferrochelatase, partial [Holophaga sp.]|nr:ferrochelatase [Holophaga sp.]
MDTTALVLLNLGGPLRVRDVEPFLMELFSDRDLIRLGPAWLQPLAARLLVKARLREVQGRYGEIGGGSPILRETAAQAQALRAALREAGRPLPVRLVFRYAPPRARGVV